MLRTQRVRFAGPFYRKAAFSTMPAAATTKAEALLRLARKGPVRARDLDLAQIPRTYLPAAALRSRSA